MTKQRRWIYAALVALLSCQLVWAGCAETPDEPDEAPEWSFVLGQDSKADGTTAPLLDPVALAAIETALTSAIDAGNVEIAKLEAEIARLDADNAKKQREIDQLVRDIEARRAEVERNFRASLVVAGVGGLFAAVFTGGLSLLAAGAAAGGLAAAIANDGRLNQLNASLSAARAQQAAITSAAAANRVKRDDLDKQLTALRTSKAGLMAILRGEASGAGLAVSAGVPVELRDPLRRVALLTSILTNTKSQVEILTRIRNLAAALGAQLDRTLATVRSLADEADRLAEESRQDFYRLLALFGEQFPLASALNWLGQVVAERTAQILGDSGTSVLVFVKFLVSHRNVGDLTAEELTERLTNALVHKIFMTAEDIIKLGGGPPPPATVICTEVAADLSEGNRGAQGVLWLVNTGSLSTLAEQARVDKRAARNIVQHRSGTDGVAGTADDNAFETIAELDAISYVGPVALGKLLNYASANGFVAPQVCH